MKHLIKNSVVALFSAAVLSACGNAGSMNTTTEQNEGTKFAPQERTSSMTAEQREEAISQKQSEQSVDFETLLDSRNLRISVLQPQGGDVTDNVADRLSMKILEIAAQNGISGLGTNPNIGLGAEILQTGRTATGSTSQKMTAQYEILFKVMNAVTGDVFGVAKQEVIGVGNSLEEASLNAMNEVKNTPEMQTFLNGASERIIGWYDSNVAIIKDQVEQAEAVGDFDLAFAILGSVPDQAPVAYKYVSEKLPKTRLAMFHKLAAGLLGEMEALVASAGDNFDPAVGAYFSLIPMDSPEHAKAQKMYADYKTKCDSRRAELERKAKQDEPAARELQKLQMLYDHEEELTRMEVEKVEARAAAAATRRQPRGLFRSIGYSITRTTDMICDGI